MTKQKRRTNCFVPGCWRKPITTQRAGYGRCKEHMFVSQSGVQGDGVLPVSVTTLRERVATYMREHPASSLHEVATGLELPLALVTARVVELRHKGVIR